MIFVTGKSGVGKSTFAKLLADKLGYDYIDIDEIGHNIYNRPHVMEKIKQLFGNEILNEDGEFDRKKLGQIIFGEKTSSRVEEFNNFTLQEMYNDIDKIIKNKNVVLDWILLPKTKYWDMKAFKILVVNENQTIRFEKIQKRDQISLEYIKARENSSIKYAMEDFDYIVENDYKKETFDLHIQNVIEKLRRKFMNGILYFSSTGNSLYIAKKVKEKIGGDVVYIPKYTGDGSEYEKIFIVTPIYSFGMPRHVYDLLPKLDKQKEIIVIQNYGGMVGGADYLLYEYAKKNGLNIKSIYKVKMPENFTLSFTVPKFYLKGVLKKSYARIDNIIKMIVEEKYILPKKCKTKEQTYLKNKGNWHLIGRDFKANDKCVGCQKCISICPVGNISMVDGKIVFGDKCVACLGCYHRCPQKAIVYKNKKKKYRYVHPKIDESEIGKNL